MQKTPFPSKSGPNPIQVEVDLKGLNNTESIIENAPLFASALPFIHKYYMVLIFRRLLASLGMTGCLRVFRERGGAFCTILN